MNHLKFRVLLLLLVAWIYGIQGTAQVTALPVEDVSMSIPEHPRHSNEVRTMSSARTSNKPIVNKAPGEYSANVMTTALINKTEEGSSLINVSAERILNYSNMDFTGTLQLAVADSKGNIIERFGDTSDVTSALGYCQYLVYSRNFTGTIPTGLPDGEYRIYLEAQQDGYSNWTKVTKYLISDNTITEIGIDCYIKFWIVDGIVSFIDNNAVYYPDMMTTGIEDNSSSSSGMLTIAVEKIMNYASKEFAGQIALAIADTNGEIICLADGKPFTGSPLPRLSYYTNTHYLTGSFPSSLGDGLYRIYVVARQEGYPQWAKLTKYTLSNNSITSTGKECHLTYEYVKVGSINS